MVRAVYGGRKAASIGKVFTNPILAISRRFFTATLTLGLEKPSSRTTSMERTMPWLSRSVKIASR